MPSIRLYKAFFTYLRKTRLYLRAVDAIRCEKNIHTISSAEQAYNAMIAAHATYEEELKNMLLANMTLEDMHIIEKIIGGFHCPEKDFLVQDNIETLQSLLLTFEGVRDSYADMEAEIEKQVRTTVQRIQQLPKFIEWQRHSLDLGVSKSRPTLADNSFAVNVVIDYHTRVMTLPSGETVMMCKSTLEVPVIVTIP
jgi:uncharacterized UPF0160 family protein